MDVVDNLDVHCPYCGESVVITFEREISGDFVQDCEVCCRPWAVRVSRGPDGIPLVRLERAQ